MLYFNVSFSFFVHSWARDPGRGRKPADLLRRCGIVERLGAQLGRESNLHAQFVNDEVERAREASGEASEDGCP